MNYYLSIGSFHLCLTDANDLFTNAQFETSCSSSGQIFDGNIDYFENVLSTYNQLIPVLKFMKQNCNGFYKNYYVTYYDNYGLIIVTDVNKKTVDIGIRPGVFGQKSFYMIYKLILTHLCRLIFQYATPIHAACVVRNHHGVCIVGASGAGKSSLAFYLQKQGCDIISDDLCVIERKNYSIQGSATQINLRPDFVQYNTLENMEVDEISPGRKISLQVNPMIEQVVTPKIMVCMVKSNESESAFQSISLEEACNLYLESNGRFGMNEWERKIQSDDFYTMLAGNDVVCYRMSLGKDINNYIMKLCEIL